MKKLGFLFIIAVVFASCGGSRPSTLTHSRGAVSKPSVYEKAPQHRMSPRQMAQNVESSDALPEVPKIESAFYKKAELIDFAKSFEGTRYRFGGTTRAGMDCSGLVCTVFEKEEIRLPRISRDMAKEGVPITLNQVEPGDLIFFKTDNQRVINHVGLVVESEEGDIKFIHSTTRRGVIISSLDENYWRKAFVGARRVI